MNSLRAIEAKGEQKDREEFLGGAVALTQVDKYGVEVNLANIVRKVRRLFSKRSQDSGE